MRLAQRTINRREARAYVETRIERMHAAPGTSDSAAGAGLHANEVVVLPRARHTEIVLVTTRLARRGHARGARSTKRSTVTAFIQFLNRSQV